MVNNGLVGGFNHREKYEWEGWQPIYEMEHRKCSNHQPVVEY